MTLRQRQDGSITLMTVFLTGMVAFLLVFADNARAVKESAHAMTDAATEQAFYSAQSCLEDAYLQLRFRETYVSPYTQAAPLVVGTGTCVLQVTPGTTPASGTLTTEGLAGNTLRSVVTGYRDAGPHVSRNNSSLMHVLDRSGSMSDQGTGCSDDAYTTEAQCLSHAELWGPRPFVNVKMAAIKFLTRLDTDHDEIGLVSYNSAPNLETNPALTTNYQSVESKILALTHGDTTNIGGAVHVAAANLPSSLSPRMRAMILLTDGTPNVGFGSLSPEDYARTEAQAAKNNGVIIITIGLGTSVNGTLLSEMASVVNSQTMYYPAPNAQDLEDIYGQIASILTSYNIGQGSWGEQ